MAPPGLFSRPFVLCFVANLFQGVAFNLFLHFPGFLDRLGASPVQVGLITGITAVSAIAARPQVGSVMDTRGRRAVILAGNAINVGVLGLYLGVDSIGPALFAVRIAHGLAESLLFASLFTYAADWVPAERRTAGLALFGVSGMLPISIGGLLGDWILANAGYDLLFQVALALAVAAGLCSLPLRDAPRGAHRDGDLPRGFFSVLRQRDLLALWWIGTVFSIALAAMFTFLKLYVDKTGIGSVGAFFGAYTAIALFLRIFFGWVPDRAGPKRVLMPALACLALGFVVLPAAQTEAGFVLAGVLCGAGHGYTFPILFSLVVTRAREADRGSAMSIYTGLFDLGVLIGGPTMGWVVGVWGFAAMYHTAAALLVAAGLLFVLFDRRRG